MRLDCAAAQIARTGGPVLVALFLARDFAKIVRSCDHGCSHSYHSGFSGMTHPRACAVSACVHRVLWLLRSSVPLRAPGLAPALLIRVLPASDVPELL
jgi:hypothetical protein